MRRIVPFAAIAICGLVPVTPAASSAAMTIGQTAPGITSNCAGTTLFVQAGIANPPAYFVPSDGVLTQWSTKGGSSDGSLGLKVVRQSAPMNYRVVGSDGPRPVPANLAQSFPIRIPVSGGEYLALWVPSGLAHPCLYVTGNPVDVAEYRAGGWPEPNVGDTFNTDTSNANVRTNIAASLEPDADHDGYGDETQDKCLGTAGTFNGCPNMVTLGKAKQKGAKVKLAVTVPGQGTLKAGSANDPALATAAKSKPLLKTVTQTFDSITKQHMTLTLKLTKAARAKLTDDGRLKLRIKVSFIPSGGPAGSQTVKAKLKS